MYLNITSSLFDLLNFCCFYWIIASESIDYSITLYQGSDSQLFHVKSTCESTFSILCYIILKSCCKLLVHLCVSLICTSWKIIWHAPKLLKRPKGGSKSKTTKVEKSWGMLFNLQHFEGRKACLNFKLKLGWTHKWEFKMRSTCIIKKIGSLMQLEWKWFDGLSKDNLSHKPYMACNL
jgi:hypothetical protein